MTKRNLAKIGCNLAYWLGDFFCRVGLYTPYDFFMELSFELDKKYHFRKWKTFSDPETIDWPSCPFCGEGFLTSEYDNYGTLLECELCHGQFCFPAFQEEVETMWKKKIKRDLKNAK
jgi:hypothetical protein